MTLLVWIPVVLSQLALVVSQIFLKHAMAQRELSGDAARGWFRQLIIGIALMTIWFLLWLGLMHQVDLSQLMPLEGISPLLIVFGAMFFLGERLTWRGWMGVGLTCLGVALVSVS